MVAVLLLSASGSHGETGAAPESSAVERLRTCGGQSFPLSVFSSPAGYQNRSTALAAKLRRDIREDRGLMPRRGWRVVFKNKKWAELVSGKPKRGGNTWASYRKVKGRWQGESSWSNCWFEPVRKGARPGEWFLAKGQKPKPTSTSIKVDVYEMDCNSGKAAWGRILAPEVEYRPKRIVVTYFVKPRKIGFATCPTNPPVPKTLRLVEELGDRKLVDGGSYPYLRRFPESRQRKGWS